MKKLSTILIILISIMLFSCQSENTVYVTYCATEGGLIIGDSYQKINKNEETQEVTVEIYDGYYFDSWSDGLETLSRKDTNITSNQTFTANIKKITKIEYKTNMKEAGTISGENSQTIKDKNGSTQVYARPNNGFKFVKWSDGETSQYRIGDKFDQDTTITAIFEYTTYDIPVITINTNNVLITSKEEYVKMDLSISNTKDEYLLSNVTGKIRGRGNSTWDMPKKPFKIKFDKKQDLFGRGSAKTWTLIANYCDKSLIRNYLAYELSSLCSGIEYTTTHEIVEVILNGEYLGVYLLCDQMQTGKTRVNIEEDSTNLDTGYLIELDNRAPDEGVENIDWFYSYDIPYAIKSPDPESDTYSVNQLQYIKSYLNKTISIIEQKDFQKIKEYIDIDSFVDSYIIQELFKNCDVGYSSFYLYKDKGGLLTAGPLWDFDISSGNCDYSDVDTPYGFRTKNVNIWYQKLMEVNEFYTLVKNRYLELQPQIKQIILECNNILENYKASFLRNFEKWPILDIYVWPNTQEIVNCNTVEAQINYLANWLSIRNNWLLGEFK